MTRNFSGIDPMIHDMWFKSELHRQLWLAALAYAAGWKRVGRLYFSACWGIAGERLLLQYPRGRAW
jgi:hypothetical protein